MPLITPKLTGDSLCRPYWSANEAQALLEEALTSTGYVLDTGSSHLVGEVSLESKEKGNCLFSLSIQSKNGFSTQLAKMYSPKDSLQLPMLFRSAAAEGHRRYATENGGALQVMCSPTQASIEIQGVGKSKSPMEINPLLPGMYVAKASAPGWKTKLDSVPVIAGKTSHMFIELSRDSLWQDSVDRFQKNRRRDSLLHVVQANPAHSLPELFARLLSITMPQDTQTVAALPFASQGENPPDYNPGLMVAEFAVRAFTKDPRFHVIERTALNRVLEEQALVQAGAVSDSAAVASGKLVAAQWVVVGSVTTQAGTQAIFARLVNVETGDIASAAYAIVENQAQRDLYRTALGERTQTSSAVYRSLVLPGWGQMYSGHSARGIFWTTLTAVGIGATVWTGLHYRDAQSDWDTYKSQDNSTVQEGDDSTSWAERAQQALDDRNDAASYVNIAIASLASIWLFNVLDAAWVGQKESQKIRARYFRDVTLMPVTNGEKTGLLLSARF
ncbi:MAG TPA: DUF5683 domain-containing protein [Fibrobacteraceae bacterium]|nr:DUF5683 domain-containing protein [Fibrobacteraceae bacterium]